LSPPTDPHTLCAPSDALHPKIHKNTKHKTQNTKKTKKQKKVKNPGVGFFSCTEARLFAKQEIPATKKCAGSGAYLDDIA
jgi:hypothetical protein